MTNMRIMWRCTENATDKERAIAEVAQQDIPGIALLRVMVPRDLFEKPDSRFEGPLVAKLLARNFHTIVMQFSTNAALTKVTEDLQKYVSSVPPFPQYNRELNYVSDQVRKDLGWDFYKPQKEFMLATQDGRHGLISVAQYQRQIPDEVYPRRCAIPVQLIPHLSRLLEKHLSIPVISWVQPGSDPVRRVYRSMAFRYSPRRSFCPFLSQATAAQTTTAAALSVSSPPLSITSAGLQQLASSISTASPPQAQMGSSSPSL
jgi:hypothetical protein